jgi:hypothetical protein
MTYFAWLIADLMERLLGPMEPDVQEEPMAYRKQIRKDPPALIRIAVLGFKQPCGCHCYEWNAVRQCCDQCVREGRIVPPKQIKPNQ